MAERVGVCSCWLCEQLWACIRQRWGRSLTKQMHTDELQVAMVNKALLIPNACSKGESSQKTCWKKWEDFSHMLISYCSNSSLHKSHTTSHKHKVRKIQKNDYEWPPASRIINTKTSKFLCFLHLFCENQYIFQALYCLSKWDSHKPKEYDLFLPEILFLMTRFFYFETL